MPAGQHPRMGALSLGIFSKGNLMTFNSIAQANALPTEHKIGFAYPSSERAKNLGHEATGCFTVEVAGHLSPARSYAQAKHFVEKLGSVPDRWSMDHPDNQRLNPHHELCGVAEHN